METVSSLCTESLELAQWTGVTVGAGTPAREGAVGLGLRVRRTPPGTQVGADALGSLWEPCTGLLSCPILADGLERTGATPHTLVPWQVDTDRDLGPWGHVARATAPGCPEAWERWS